jgi:hypothetical protein
LNLKEQLGREYNVLIRKAGLAELERKEQRRQRQLMDAETAGGDKVVQDCRISKRKI